MGQHSTGVDNVDLPFSGAELATLKSEPPELRKTLEFFLKHQREEGPFYCNQCKEFRTNEGLILKTSNDDPREGFVTREETGRGRVVLFREIENPDHRVKSDIALLISELAKALKSRMSPDHRVVAEFNSHAAILRLLRYFDEEDPLRVSLSEQQKHFVQKLLRLLTDQQSRDIPGDDAEDIVTFDPKLRDEVEDCARRKKETRYLFSLSTDDAIPISALNEAREAYRWGLFRATLAVCRAGLERSVQECIKILKATPTNGRVRRDELETRIDDLFQKLGTRQKKQSAQRLRQLGNQALHDFEPISSEMALEGLRITFTLLPFLVLRSRKLMSN